MGSGQIYLVQGIVPLLHKPIFEKFNKYPLKKIQPS